MSQVDWNILAPYFGLPVGAQSAKRRAEAKLRNADAARDAGAMKKAKRLAALHDIEIDRDRPGEYWVTCAAFDETTDPLDGAHFCVKGREVLEAVEAYVAALDARTTSP